jgi:hypothetical protein
MTPPKPKFASDFATAVPCKNSVIATGEFGGFSGDAQCSTRPSKDPLATPPINPNLSRKVDLTLLNVCFYLGNIKILKCWQSFNRYGSI